MAAGVRGLQNVVATMRAMGDAPTEAGRRTARQRALKLVLSAERSHLERNKSIVTKALYDALMVAESPKRNRSEVGPRTGTVNRQNPSRRQHLLEYGTAPHWQPRRNGGQMHPGARPKPHVRPAFEETKDAMIKVYFETMIEVIKTAGNRVARGRPK